MAGYDQVPVLHFVAANTATPPEILLRLSKHKNFEVRTGIASNSSARLHLLLTLRTVGKYTTVNEYLARNPNVPANLLREMYEAGEIGNVGIAMNANCPPDIMRKIFAERA